MKFHRSRRVFASFAGVCLVFAAMGAAAFVGACDGADTTSQKRVSFATRIVADDGIEAPLTNAFGWTISLDVAAVSIGPVYYFSGAPVVASRSWLSPLIGVAHGHPGHYQPGDAMGQVLASSSVDLALGAADLPAGEGVSGIYRSARFSFEPSPQGKAEGALAGHVVVIEGQASKETMTRIFRMEADASDVLDALGEPHLEGCVFSGEPDVQANGTMTIHVAPSVWLDQAEFDAVPESADGKPVLLPKDGVAFRAIARGLKKASAITFQYSTP